MPLALFAALALVQTVAREDCRPVNTPNRLPTVSELVDSSALASRVIGVTGTGSPEIQLGVAFPKPAGPPEVWVIDSGATLDAEATAAIVQTALRASSAAPGTTLRLLLRVANPIEVRLQRSILCAPVPLDSENATPPGVKVTGGAGGAVPAYSWKAGIRQRIGADGVVQEARLQPGSGRPDLDRVALLPVYARRWRPATLDGRPVAVWFVGGRVDLVR